VVLEIVIIAGGAAADLRQPVPWNGGKIVVFVVVADVEGYEVQNTVVAEGFLLFVVGQVVFLDPPGAEGVEADREEEAQQEVGDGFRAEEIPHGGDEYDLCAPVEGDPFIEGLDFAESLDAEDLEQRIKQQPDDLADEIVVDQFSLPTVGQIGVQLVYTLEGVVFDMITLERYRARE